MQSSPAEDTISFFVAGEPKPQGSTKSFYIRKTDKVVTTHGSRDTKAWRERIANEAQRASEAFGGFYREGDFAYIVQARFQFSAPKSHAKSYYYRHNKRPDLDKIVRALLDGITGILIEDDAQVEQLEVKKEYTNRYVSLESPGVHVRLIRVRGRFKV